MKFRDGGLISGGSERQSTWFRTCLFQVVAGACGQGFERAAIHVQVAYDLAGRDFDRMNVVRHQRDARARLHHDGADFLELGLARHRAVVLAFVHVVELGPFHGADAGPGGVVVRHDAFAGAHHVQVQRKTLVGIFRDQVTSLQFSVFGRGELAGAPQLCAPGQLIECCQNLGQGLTGGIAISDNFLNVFDAVVHRLGTLC